MNFPVRLLGAVLAALLLTLPARAATVNVQVGNNFFNPANITINLNDTVTWTWVGSGHDIVCGAADPRCGNTTPAGTLYNAGNVYSKQYTSVGTFNYFCTPHQAQGMVGSVTVNSANTAPTLSGGSATISYTENQAAVTVGGSITASDTSGTLAGATVSISVNYQNGQDALSFTAQGGISGSFNAGSGNIVFTGSASVSTYSTLLQSVKYGNSSENPSSASRTISFTVTDGSLSSSALTRTVNVTAVNDAPVLGSTASTLAYTEGNGAVAIDSAITVSDVDSANLDFAEIKVSTNYVSGEDLLQFTDQLGITGGAFDTGTGTIQLSGSQSVANWLTALRTVKYLNSSGNPSTLTRTVSFKVRDGTSFSNITNRNIAITAINNPPAVAITNHASSTHAVIGGNLNLKAAATDSDGSISNVEFFQGSTSLALLSVAPYNFVVSNLASGVFNFTAVATDNQAAKSTSSVVQVTTGNLALLTNSPPQFSGPQFQFQFTSDGGVFAVQVSTNLVDWVTLTTVPSSPGTQTVNDTPTGQTLRFYRIITPPPPE
jgi:plastocyanin